MAEDRELFLDTPLALYDKVVATITEDDCSFNSVRTAYAEGEYIGEVVGKVKFSGPERNHIYLISWKSPSPDGWPCSAIYKKCLRFF